MKQYTIFAVSDGTAMTAKLVIQAVLAQFPKVVVEVSLWPRAKTDQSIHQLIQRGQSSPSPSIIVYTLVSPHLRELLIKEARSANIPAIDLLGPLLCRMEEFFQVAPKGIPGIFKPSLNEFDPRIEAINFTVDHDDGQKIATLDQADMVLVGVSRTSKTPLSIYLSSRGWKVANIPIILGIQPPDRLAKIDQKKIIALTIKAERLATIRYNRMQKFHLKVNNAYSDLVSVQREIDYAESIFHGPPAWPVIDVTNKSIEEIAQEVIIALTQAMEEPSLAVTNHKE